MIFCQRPPSTTTLYAPLLSPVNATCSTHKGCVVWNNYLNLPVLVAVVSTISVQSYLLHFECYKQPLITQALKITKVWITSYRISRSFVSWQQCSFRGWCRAVGRNIWRRGRRWWWRRRRYRCCRFIDDAIAIITASSCAHIVCDVMGEWPTSPGLLPQ